MMLALLCSAHGFTTQRPLSRRSLLIGAAYSSAQASSANARTTAISSDDGAMAFTLPSGWKVSESCSPSRKPSCAASGPRTIFIADRLDGGAAASATIDLGAYGKTLSDFSTLEDANSGKMVSSAP